MRQQEAPRPHILAAVGEAVQQIVLTQLGCALAGEDGLLTLLCITPDGAPPQWLTTPECSLSPPVRVDVRAGDEPGQVILDTVEELDPDVLLLGWTGEEGSRQYLLGSTLDTVIRHARCDVAVARANEWKVPQRALVPAAGGPNASLAIELALLLSPDIEVTALHIAREAAGPLGVAAGREQLSRMLERWRGDRRVRAKVIRSPATIDGILGEAATGYDLLLIGASNESYIDRKLFGDVPQTIAVQAVVPTLVVRRRAGPIKSLIRQAERVLSDVEDYVTSAERVAAYREIRRGARPRLDFFMLIGFAAAIASLGLMMDSAAVVIGAMVIAPLMSAIFGISMGIVQGDVRLLWQAASTTLRGAGLAVVIGFTVGILIPLIAPANQILSRTEPTLLDLVVALVSGAAGAYAQCRRSALGSLAGVAIAVSLVPPLAMAGIGISMGSGAIAGNALLVFLTNLSAITAASSIVFRLFGFHPGPGRRVRVFGQGMVGVLILLLVVSTILTTLTVDSILETRVNRQVENALRAEMAGMPGLELDGWRVLDGGNEAVRLEVTVRSTQPLSQQEAIDLQERVAANLGYPVSLVLSVTYVTRLDLRAVPTPTIAPDTQ